LDQCCLLLFVRFACHLHVALGTIYLTLCAIYRTSFHSALFDTSHLVRICVALFAHRFTDPFALCSLSSVLAHRRGLIWDRTALRTRARDPITLAPLCLRGNFRLFLFRACLHWITSRTLTTRLARLPRCLTCYAAVCSAILCGFAPFRTSALHFAGGLSSLVAADACARLLGFIRSGTNPGSPVVVSPRCAVASALAMI